MKSIHTIHGRLFLIFLFSLLGLLLIVSFVYYQRATEQIRDKVAVIAEKNISQTVGLFDLMLKGYDSITKSLNSNNELMRLLRQSNVSVSSDTAFSLERRITDILGAIFYSRNDIVGIHILTNQGEVYSFDRSVGGAVRSYSEKDWFTQLQQSSGEMIWLGVFPHSLVSESITPPDRSVFAFGRELFELSTLRPIGIVLIETDADAITSALSNASLGPGSNVIIRDAQGKEIMHTMPTDAVTNFRQIMPKDWPGPLKQGQVIVTERKNALVTAARISMADWTVIGETPKQDLQLELKQTQQFLLTFILVLVVAATLLATLVSRSFSSPFKRLIQQMKQVELGNFKGIVRVHSYHELNVLVSSFNRMVYQMDELIERIKLASISEKHAQLQALQSQVNPHFLFNTLDMIYWMLDERENDRLGKVILALSQMFRYSSDWEEASRATLRLEIEQLQHYLTIIEMRLGKRVNTTIDVDEEQLLDTEVPKMILQPIVENAVKYGLEPLNRQGSLRIYSRETSGKLEIVVEDNGVGMDEETLQRIERMLEETPLTDTAMTAGSNGRRGVGLFNVHQRIRLMFGEGYGLRIESKRNSHTTVIASFPAPARKGELA
jgi:two-component system, sensor histidine kinase YesM